MAHPIENKLTQIYWYLVSAQRLSTRSAYQTYQLSRALRIRYADGSPSPAIDKAIEQIERF